jgi:hypothetical protein
MQNMVSAPSAWTDHLYVVVPELLARVCIAFSEHEISAASPDVAGAGSAAMALRDQGRRHVGRHADCGLRREKQFTDGADRVGAVDRETQRLLGRLPARTRSGTMRWRRSHLPSSVGARIAALAHTQLRAAR